jgi:hypothetical protein
LTCLLIISRARYEVGINTLQGNNKKERKLGGIILPVPEKK